ncbi:DUF1569 domain-containing protein [Nonlabens sp.]|uniref:DUF1569 domain-containing protein n=1 Tax=Nonlabens sp. TaxID=1888209 RepID=UPI003F6980E3
MERLKDQLEEIKKLIAMGPIHNIAVSQVNTYWHLDHTLQVIHGIPQALKDSDPKAYSPKFSFVKFMIMTFKKIPRGKGRSPKHIMPEGNISKEELNQWLTSAKEDLKSIENLASNCYFEHPLFGHLNVKEAEKFLWIHTHHHLKIVRDMIKN